MIIPLNGEWGAELFTHIFVSYIYIYMYLAIITVLDNVTRTVSRESEPYSDRAAAVSMPVGHLVYR